MSVARNSGELSYKFAVRGAVLTRNHKNAHQTKTRLRDLYNARSGIVHDGRHPKDSNLYKDSNELTRLILKSYLEKLAMGISVKDINDWLEDRIIKG